jgi:hypothetical protein
MDAPVYALERVSTLWPVLAPLLERHYSELGGTADVPLDIDRGRYEALDASELLRVFTVRVDGELVGYSCHLVYAHAQTATVRATEEAIYISPPFRGIGQSFIRWCDTQLSDEGISHSYRTTKSSRNHGELLRRCGYAEQEVVFSRRLTLPYLPQEV